MFTITRSEHTRGLARRSRVHVPMLPLMAPSLGAADRRTDGRTRTAPCPPARHNAGPAVRLHGAASPPRGAALLAASRREGQSAHKSQPRGKAGNRRARSSAPSPPRPRPRAALSPGGGARQRRVSSPGTEPRRRRFLGAPRSCGSLRSTVPPAAAGMAYGQLSRAGRGGGGGLERRPPAQPPPHGVRRGLYSDCSAGREPARPRGGVTAARGAEGRSEGYGRPAARPAGVNPRAAAIPVAVQLRAPPHRYRRRGRFSLAAAPPSPLRSGTRPPPCFRSADWAAAEISGSRLAFGRVSHGSRGGHTWGGVAPRVGWDSRSPANRPRAASGPRGPLGNAVPGRGRRRCRYLPAFWERGGQRLDGDPGGSPPQRAGAAFPRCSTELRLTAARGRPDPGVAGGARDWGGSCPPRAAALAPRATRWGSGKALVQLGRRPARSKKGSAPECDCFLRGKKLRPSERCRYVCAPT